MPVYSLKTVQKIPIDINKAWDFFSSPANLSTITPAEMKFNIISKHHGEKMYAGQIIEYTVSPVSGIKLYWMTEITHVQPMDFFIDEQRYGPYAMWHHQHHFKAIEGGVEMTDIVHYKNPLGILGKMANGIFVRPKLRGIFEFRFDKVEALFGKWPGVQERAVEM
jgi:ligand-binding SRPBCC domain-containing protein